MMTALHILLLILKILGIVILSIIGLILLIILIVMIVPIRYKVEGSYYENDPKGKLRVSYLLPLFAFYLELIDKKPVMKIRILGIPISLGKKKEKKKKGSGKNAESQEQKTDPEAADMRPDDTKEKDSDESQRENEDRHKTVSILSDDEFAQLIEELGADEELLLEGQDQNDPDQPEETGPDKAGCEAEAAKEPEASEEPEASKKSRPGKKPKPEKPKKQPKPEKPKKQPKPEKTPEEIEREKEEKRKKLEKLKSTFEMISAELKNPENKHFLRVVKRSIGKILHHLLPTKLRAYVHYGVEDNPAQMGQILSYAGMLYPIYGKSIRLEPEFDRKVMEGDFRLWGRIRPGTLVCALLRIVFTKRVFQLVKMLLKKRKANQAK